MDALQHLMALAERDPLSSSGFEVWFLQQGFMGSGKMAAGYAWLEAKRRIAAALYARAAEQVDPAAGRALSDFASALEGR